MWRETPDCATNHTISYARSRDFVHWETSAGAPLPLPITLATGEVIDGAKPGGGLINMTFNLGFDREKRPLVVYHRYDAAGKSQVYIARPNPGSRTWESRQLSDWDFRWAFSGGGSIPAEVKLSPPRAGPAGTILVDYTTLSAGSGRWQINEASLAVVARQPAAPAALPADVRRPSASGTGMEVQTLVSRAGGKRWVLRWETLGRNRDRPRESAPPPSELRLYELPDADTSQATHVGS
jgi:hypothetical protein